MSGYPHTLRPELHKALEAEGIDYWLVDGITFWNRDDGCECLAYGYKADGVPKLAIKVVGFTDPEQAVAITMGLSNYTNGERTNGTCQADETETIECVCDDVWHYGKRLTLHVMECSECGHTYEHVNGSYEYCPRCGAKVVAE